MTNDEEKKQPIDEFETTKKDFKNKQSICSRPSTGKVSKGLSNLNSISKNNEISNKIIPWTPESAATAVINENVFKSFFTNDHDNNLDSKYNKEPLTPGSHIKYSKNKDKLEMKAIKIAPDKMKGINNLLHQTNNLMLYKSKMKSLLNVDEYRKDTNIFNLQKQALANKIERYDKIHEIDFDKMKTHFQEHIYGKIDHLIERLEKR